MSKPFRHCDDPGIRDLHRRGVRPGLTSEFRNARVYARARV